MVERVNSRVAIRSLKTGVPGLDEVLGGGLPEYAFSMIAGGPGAGKTTLVQQFTFANATPERPALYITVLGEPTLKLLRHQQQFSFFDVDRIGKDIHFVISSGAQKVSVYGDEAASIGAATSCRRHI